MTSTSALVDKTIPYVDVRFARDVLYGLSRPKKSLPCRYFYDARGSELFDQITMLQDYYPTRCEMEILRAQAERLAASMKEGSIFVEFGSGSSEKTEILLEQIRHNITYVPLDISESALKNASRRISSNFPNLLVRPIVADFTTMTAWPAGLALYPVTLFFPGSTIGNLHPAEAQSLLQHWRSLLAQGGRLIIGVDLLKDERVLLPAYNDRDGVTAAFNKNILVRLNRDLRSNFDLNAFEHTAIFNKQHSRIEMHLVSKANQNVDVCGRTIQFKANETIHTENSYKYTIDGFQRLAEHAGWTAAKVWTDQNNWFSVHELEVKQ